MQRYIRIGLLAAAMMTGTFALPVSAVGDGDSVGDEDAGSPAVTAPDAQPETSVKAPTFGLSDVSFYVFALVAVVSCLGVVFSMNIVRSAMWLLGTLGAVALLYFNLMANFLGAVQLIVYAGGILVLIIFGIMLTSKSPYVRMTPGRGEIVGGSVVCLLLFGFLVRVLTSVSWHAASAGASVEHGAVEHGAAVIPVAELGKGLLTTYLVPFEVASVLLLVVMIGAAYLVRTEKET